MAKQNITIANANTMLEAILEHGVDLDDGLSQLGLDAEAQATLRDTLTNNLSADFAGKVFVGGTGKLREIAHLANDEATPAFGALKATGRMVQIGKGRGRGLVVTNPKKLTQADWNALLVSGTVETDEAPAASAPASTPTAPTPVGDAGDFAHLEARIADVETQVRELLEALRGVKHATSNI